MKFDCEKTITVKMTEKEVDELVHALEHLPDGVSNCPSTPEVELVGKFRMHLWGVTHG